VILLAVSACTDDRDAINASDHVFKLVDTDYSPPGTASNGGITLKFTDLDDKDTLTWEGEIDEGIRHLERLDVGTCYRRPLRAPERVSCAEHGG
jgi:hypothetical protein